MRVAIALLLGLFDLYAQVAVQIVPNDAVTLRNAKAIAVGPGELVYIADSGHHRVVAIDSTGKLIAESGHGGSSGAQMLWPVDVSAAAGNVYVADAGNKRILKFSRLLEWQGEFEILSSEGYALEPRLIAASQQGDIFVYESDEGQILRYDPLFTLQNRLGSASGSDFLQAPARMTHSDKLGITWIDRSGDIIYASDRFLSGQRKVASALIGSTDIAAYDSIFWLANDSTITRVGGGVATLAFRIRDLPAMKSSGDLVCAPFSDTGLYVLDRRKGRLFRVHSY